MERNRAVFLDRDGTINVDVHYLGDPAKFKIYPGVAQGVKRLQDAGFLIIVITNQSGIARGYYGLGTLGAIHRQMREELGATGVKVNGIYFCPHHPDDGCQCRKPGTGMLEQAIAEYDIDAARSYMLGDKPKDAGAGQNVGAMGILIPEPNERDALMKERKNWVAEPDYLADDFTDAVNWILQQEEGTQ